MSDQYESFIKSNRCLCVTCRRKLSEDGSEECFRCRVASVGFSFVGGGGYGRTNFSEKTNGEFLNEHVGDVKQGLRDGTLAPSKDYW